MGSFSRFIRQQPHQGDLAPRPLTPTLSPGVAGGEGA